MSTPLLTVENLSVHFNNTQCVVNNISFMLYSGECFALVGESGSGKSITALSIAGLLPANAKLNATQINLNNENLLTYSETQLCAVRGRRIGFIFQDPMSSLNPVMTIGKQIEEVLKLHFKLSKHERHERVLELLTQVEIPNPAQRIKTYPHQLSGGQRQRVMIAIALAAKPDLLIADEPTTALDVTIQAQLLNLLKRLQQQTGMTLWLISHDLALVSTIADRVAVMQKGNIVEMGSSLAFFKNPQHAYTRQLLNALPRLSSATNCKMHEQHDTPLLQVSDFYCYYPIRKGLFKRVVGHVKAVDGVSFNLAKGKTLALVGESGCGKTSLGKSLLNLIPNSGGQVFIDGVALHNLSEEALRLQRAALQIIFQDPFASMNPRMLVGDIIAEGIRALYPKTTSDDCNAQVIELLKQVDLPESSALRYPHEFSGGQRQRICIARALAVKPKLIVCDEPTSALDVSVQAQIIELLKHLQQKHDMSYLFISHDFGVVAELADEIAVMYQGKIVEHGSAVQVLTNPTHAYTQSLLAAVPMLVE